MNRGPIVIPMGLFRRRARKPTGASFDTGNPGDDQLLALLADTPGGLTAPRDWIHYVYCSSADGAASMEARALEHGWTVRRVHEGEGIVASRQDLAVTPASVVEVRRFFEGLATSVEGGEYDGWEASAG
jgi:hypothetical protein